ncbi:MAG: response regulator [Desulfovibrionaceae bacterium]|jgi:CheY-like chemotaxis protein|nr:response regulator [Desulfovibrionaceae bacterium]
MDTRNATILHVEDERITAMEFNMVLTRLGYRCRTASSGEQALTMARGDPPDLAILDIMLEGGLDGIETALRLRAEMRVPIIFCSAYSTPEVVAQADQARPLAYLVKPVDFDRLRTVLERAVPPNRCERDCSMFRCRVFT